MKRSYAQSEASLSDSDAGDRSKRPACRQQQQQQPASPENPHKLVEVSLSRRQEELYRSSCVAELLPLSADDGRQSAAAKSDASRLAVIVPRCADWFSYGRVHRIERLAFPQFFANEGSVCRTPRLYVAYRNCMIDSYRADPRRRLSLAACSRQLPGDIRLLAGVHAFLEHWGLVNLQADEDADLGPDDAGAAPSHLLRLADASGDVLEPDEAFGIEAELPDGQSELQTDDAAASEQQQQQHQHQPILLGPELRYPSVRGRNDWSDAELLALLEGVELYKEDWGRVADRVGGGRTQEECIVQMLKLPILDPYLEGVEQVLGPVSQKLSPFGQAANPVMCTVAFLAAAVDPRVASAAALAALGEYGQLADSLPPASASAASSAPEPSSSASSSLASSSSSSSSSSDAQASALRSAAGRIAASVLSSAAAKSSQLAEVELCRMRALALQLAEAQMKKIEVKLRHYQELDAVVDKERECIEAQMQQVHLERQCLHRELLRSAGQL